QQEPIEEQEPAEIPEPEKNWVYEEPTEESQNEITSEEPIGETTTEEIAVVSEVKDGELSIGDAEPSTDDAKVSAEASAESNVSEESPQVEAEMIPSVEEPATKEAKEATLQSEEKDGEKTAERMAGSGTCGESVSWTLDDNGVLTISGSGAMYDYFQKQTPWNSCQEQVRKLVVQSGVTELGRCAFTDCEYLTSAIIPEGITTLPHACFLNCTSLRELALPESLKRLENECLWNTGIRVFAVPASVTEVEGHFFGSASGETEEIRVAPGNSAFTAVNGVMFSKDLKTLVQYPCNKSTDYTVPVGTEVIREHAFAFNSFLQSVTIPASVNRIMGWSFYSMTNLKTVYYLATQEQWNQIVETNNNESLLNSEIIFSPGGFADVSDPTQYYYEPVYWAYDYGITSGTSSTTFSPFKICTRGQIVSFLWKAMGSPEPTELNNPFTDVKESDYFYKPVLWAKEEGITAGKTATTFAPYSPCTRAQIMTFLWKALGSPAVNTTSSPFTDVKSSDYFYKPVLWAKDKGITSGTSATSFGSANSCTRAQAMTFLYKADQLNSSGQPDMRTVLDVSLSQGSGHPYCTMLEQINTELSAATNGRYTLEIFPASMLGSEADSLEGVIAGSIDMAIVGNNYICVYSPDFEILNAPYLFESMEHQKNVFASGDSAINGLYATAENVGVEILSSFSSGMRSLYTRNEPVRTPADLAGMKIRVPNTEGYVKAIRAMGGTPTALAMSELYAALQMGVVDGSENPIPLTITQASINSIKVAA
ncbi:MAG: TRAP transporter substrate-binding protein DctP, partial [Oscillospiraceae bacterium]|nr:TRAP transporter substrate-binding protein DctP [Oscillospiraceae bacterium]